MKRLLSPAVLILSAIAVLALSRTGLAQSDSGRTAPPIGVALAVLLTLRDVISKARTVVRGRLFFAIVAGSLLQVPPAFAAFPGANGLVVFQSNRDGNAEIYVMNADGTGQTNLTNNPATDSMPAWSADGSKIAFSSDRDGTIDLYIMNADGTGVTRVTNDAATDYFAAWSPDGSRIAFARFVNNYDIWTVNVDGTGLVNLTNHPAEDAEPAWSPDGSKIAFRTSRGTFFDNEIFVMNPDGTGLVNLTTDPGWDGSPDWSPDGSKLLFGSTRTGTVEVWVMNADGTAPMALTATPLGDGTPAWSPDGTRIVFQSFRDFNDEIYVMNADGTNQVRLTNNAPPGSTIPEDWFPDWQPLNPTPPSGQRGLRQTNDYGYIALQREAGCISEELWTGMNYESIASLARGGQWSRPNAYAWAWYRATNNCTSNVTTAFGLKILQPHEFSIVPLDLASFATTIDLFTGAPPEGGPPFLSCVLASCELGPTASFYGTVFVNMTMTKEGHPLTFNFNGGVPPLPQSGLGPLGGFTTWRYIGGPVTGSVTGSINFAFDSLFIAEMGQVETHVLPSRH